MLGVAACAGGESDREYYASVTYRYTDEYAVGDRMTARVVSTDPERSYLIEAAMPWWYYLIPGFGTLLALAGLLNVVQGVRGVGPGAN